MQGTTLQGKHISVGSQNAQRGTEQEADNQERQDEVGQYLALNRFWAGNCMDSTKGQYVSV